MREMCKDFLVESETEVIEILPVKDKGKPMVSPKLCDNMAVLDCNTCVLQSIGLAQAFVPFQPNANTMEPAQSLICGTAFSDLVMPYVKGSNLNKPEVTP